MKKILVTDPNKRIDINGIKEHPFYLNGKEIFEEKFLVLDYDDDFAKAFNKKRRVKGFDDDFGNRSFEILSDRIDVEKMIEDHKKRILEREREKNERKKRKKMKKKLKKIKILKKGKRGKKEMKLKKMLKLKLRKIILKRKIRIKKRKIKIKM